METPFFEWGAPMLKRPVADVHTGKAMIDF
jgi:hypothetical protein